MLRCELSEEYFKLPNKAHRAERSKGRRGTVLSIDEKRSVYKVMWDGTKTPQHYHKDFLKILS